MLQKLRCWLGFHRWVRYPWDDPGLMHCRECFVWGRWGRTRIERLPTEYAEPQLPMHE